MSILGIIAAAEDEPSPTPPAPDTVPIELWEASPGIYGFLFFFAMACALIVLVRSMLRHSRTVEQNSQRRDNADARDAEARADAETTKDADAPGDSAVRTGDQNEPST